MLLDEGASNAGASLAQGARAGGLEILRKPVKPAALRAWFVAGAAGASLAWFSMLGFGGLRFLELLPVGSLCALVSI